MGYTNISGSILYFGRLFIPVDIPRHSVTAVVTFIPFIIEGLIIPSICQFTIVIIMSIIQYLSTGLNTNKLPNLT